MIGGIVGGVALIVLICLVCCCCKFCACCNSKTENKSTVNQQNNIVFQA